MCRGLALNVFVVQPSSDQGDVMATSSKSKSSAGTGGFSAFKMPGFENVSKMMEQFKLPGVDMSALVEWQRKDLEALAEANREAFEGYKTLFERRNEMFKDALGKWQQNLASAANPSAMAKRTEAAREDVQKAVDDFRELVDLEAQARKRAWKVVQDRMQENMAHLQGLMQPKK
jgi:phasin family protein